MELVKNFLNTFVSFLIRRLSFFLVDLYIAVKRIYGTDKALNIFIPVMDFIGKKRAPIMARLGKVKLQDMSSLGKIQDMEDMIFGVFGTWEKAEKDEAIKVEMFCPFAQKLKGHSEFCHVLVKRFEESTFRSLNPSYSLEIKGKLLSEHNGTGCIFIHKLK
ncbi:MAG: hypothetical protein NZ927_00545 [Candidatus Calescibacterium sp.]|nr:hypothetical protein [Candidatus Calescibacterium sp.]MCX7733857.1 hypothetical protein [bacterium]MDW8086638.1 hypothetical protein [Candidatus Calescibacterium sp.]